MVSTDWNETWRRSEFKGEGLKEFDLGKLDALKVPMAIDYLPEKTEGREIGWRYTFLGKYGVNLLSWPAS